MTEKAKKKLRSTTFWFAMISLILVPVSWVVEHFLKMDMLTYIIQNNIKEIADIERLVVDIPQEAIVTLATFAISLYTAGRRGRDIVEVATHHEKSSQEIVTVPSEDNVPPADGT